MYAPQCAEDASTVLFKEPPSRLQDELYSNSPVLSIPPPKDSSLAHTTPIDSTLTATSGSRNQGHLAVESIRFLAVGQAGLDPASEGDGLFVRRPVHFALAEVRFAQRERLL